MVDLEIKDHVEDSMSSDINTDYVSHNNLNEIEIVNKITHLIDALSQNAKVVQLVQSTTPIIFPLAETGLMSKVGNEIKSMRSGGDLIFGLKEYRNMTNHISKLRRYMARGSFSNFSGKKMPIPDSLKYANIRGYLMSEDQLNKILDFVSKSWYAEFKRRVQAYEAAVKRQAPMFLDWVVGNRAVSFLTEWENQNPGFKRENFIIKKYVIDAHISEKAVNDLETNYNKLVKNNSFIAERSMLEPISEVINLWKKHFNSQVSTNDLKSLPTGNITIYIFKEDVEESPELIEFKKQIMLNYFTIERFSRDIMRRIESMNFNRSNFVKLNFSKFPNLLEVQEKVKEVSLDVLEKSRKTADKVIKDAYDRVVDIDAEADSARQYKMQLYQDFRYIFSQSMIENLRKVLDWNTDKRRGRRGNLDLIFGNKEYIGLLNEIESMTSIEIFMSPEIKRKLEMIKKIMENYRESKSNDDITDLKKQVSDVIKGLEDLNKGYEIKDAQEEEVISFNIRDLKLSDYNVDDVKVDKFQFKGGINF